MGGFFSKDSEGSSDDIPVSTDILWDPWAHAGLSKGQCCFTRAGWVSGTASGEKNNTETLWGWERITARVRIYSRISILYFWTCSAWSFLWCLHWRGFSVVYAGAESKHWLHVPCTIMTLCLKHLKWGVCKCSSPFRTRKLLSILELKNFAIIKVLHGPQVLIESSLVAWLWLTI